MVEVKNVAMSYGKNEVLKDISFEIKNGRTVGLLGANGAGKSTTMNILSGYLKPCSGKVFIEGIDITSNPVDAKRLIGYLPEIPPLYRDMKVIEYLTFAAKLKGIREYKAEVNKMMELFHLEEKCYDFIKRLSKGQQQRVGFAYALLGTPPVIILDEPLVGLDPIEAEATRKIISTLKGEHIVIISSHILKEIEELCNDILMLKDGKIILDNSMLNAKRGGKHTYCLTLKGQKEKLEEYLKQYGELKEVRFVGEKEKDVYEFVVVSKNTRDIRDNILGYLVSKKIKVYGIMKQELSLEEVFIKMNEEEV